MIATNCAAAAESNCAAAAESVHIVGDGGRPGAKATDLAVMNKARPQATRPPDWRYRGAAPRCRGPFTRTTQSGRRSQTRAVFKVRPIVLR
jgi:hypothetical protein